MEETTNKRRRSSAKKNSAPTSSVDKPTSTRGEMLKVVGTAFKRNLRNMDWYIVIPYIILCVFGTVMIYSASVWWAIVQYDSPPDHYYIRQLRFLVMGFVLASFAALISYRIYREKTIMWLIAGGTLLLLGLVHIIGYGKDTVGSQSWISFGFFSLQPSEMAKLGIILILSGLIANRMRVQSIQDISYKRYILYLVFPVLCLFSIGNETDLGAVIIVAGITVSIYMLSGIPFKKFAIFTGGMGLAMGLAIAFMALATDIFNGSRLGRFEAWFNPFEHARDTGYQIVQGYLAIGAGGLEGVGLGQSSQKLGFIPEPQTDFIMAVISEEMGFIGVLLVVGLLYLIVCRALFIALTTKDPFARMVAGAIGVWIGLQTCINLGGMVGFLPLTGVTLPFISYGGSSLILLSLAIGILINISINEKIRKRKKHKGEG
ncbi:FtsW/RodA/SpoVE family cell cycle protein [Caryophanon tenue]|nr:FtsW/RodA/SpoVE family cell cycle protein [Caryophanon tenue]